MGKTWNCRAVLRVFMGTAVLTACAIALIGPSSAQAAAALTVTTTLDRDSSEPGIACPADEENECTLRAAVDTVNAGDTVLLPDLGANYILADDIEITESLSIVGEGASSVVITPDPDAVTSDHRFFTINAPGASIELRDLTLRDAAPVSAATHGGALAIFDAAWLELYQVSLISNSTTAGDSANAGSIYFGATSINARFIESQFQSNSGDAGGAITLDRTDGSVIFDRTTFIDNSAESVGGAIAAVSSPAEVIIERSTFTGNSAQIRGGASFSNAGTLDSYRTSFVGNHAPNGGTISLNSGVHLTVENSTFLGNAAAVNGSVLETTGNGNTAIFNFTTFADHTDAFAIHDTSTVQVRNSAISQTSGCASVDADGTVVTDVPLPACGAAEVPDLRLNSTVSDDYLVPMNASPLVDHVAGDCPTTDQRGVTRTAPCTAGAIDTAGVVCETPIPRSVEVTCSLDIGLVDDADVLVELNPILFNATIPLDSPGTGSVTFTVPNDAPLGDVVVTVASAGVPYVHSFSVAPPTENGSPGGPGDGGSGSSGSSSGGSDINGGGSTSNASSTEPTTTPPADVQGLPPILPVTGAPLLTLVILGLGFTVAGILLWRTSARERS